MAATAPETVATFLAAHGFPAAAVSTCEASDARDVGVSAAELAGGMAQGSADFGASAYVGSRL